MDGSPVGDCFPGKVVGNYTLQEQIGKGSFGTVFRSVDQAGNEVAIKVIPRRILVDQNQKPNIYKKAFDQEVDIMRMIKHPKIIKLREKLQSGNNYYLVLDYCEDGDLNQYLESGGPMKEGDGIDALKQLALGFQELHRLGIMHRDFKPANVFIHKGNFIIGDLGMAKKASATASKVGTPITMAPEVSDRSGKMYDSTVDLFSLGVTFYYMLFKEWPWKPDVNLALHMRKRVGPRLEFPDDADRISEDTKTLLRKMIALREDRLNWSQFFLLLDKLEVPGTFLKPDNKAFNDMLFKLGVKKAEKMTELQSDADENELASDNDIEKLKLLLALVDPDLAALLQIAGQQRPSTDPSDIMKRSDVKFWYNQIEHNRNLVRFYLGHCDFLKQNWKIRDEFPAGFGNLLLQIGLALMHKARTFLGITSALITQQIQSEDFPKIDTYLKTQHAKNVLQDLENFRREVQGQYASLLSKAAMEVKANEKNMEKAKDWVELIKMVEIDKKGVKEVNAYCKEKLQALLKLIPHVDQLSSEDYSHPITSKMLVSFLRIYQMVYEDDEMPKPRSDAIETEWKNFFKQSITVDLIKTNFFKARGRLN